MEKTRLKADLLLLLTALIWGIAFVAQRVAALEIGVFLFNAVRFFLGAAVLWGITALRTRRLPNLRFNRQQLTAVAAAGSVLFLGSAFQQAGLQYTSAANAGFITGLYVVFVPLLLAVGFQRKLGWNVWAAALIAVLGLLLLSTGGVLQINLGDLLELVGAFMWAGHVLVVGWTVRWMPVSTFSIGQFLFAGTLQLISGIIFERPIPAWTTQVWISVLYVAIFSTAIGYTLQAAGQRHAPETDAAFLLNLESVFAALAGYLILGETLLPIQILGAGLILAAVFISQLPVFTSRKIPFTPP